MTNHLRVALAQINLLVGDIEGNAEKMRQMAQQAVARKADVIVFPELSLTGYPPEDLLLRPSLYRRVQWALDELAAAVPGIAMVLGSPQQTEQGIYNSALVLQDGSVRAQYYKHCLPNYSVFDEKRYFHAGDEACVFEIKGIPVALTICEDIWHRVPMQKAAKAGAKLVLNLNASPFHLGKELEREAVVAERVGECDLPLVYVNLVGGQDELVFDGCSFVMDAQGRLCQRSPSFSESLDFVDMHWDGEQLTLEPAAITPLLGEQASVYQALVCGVRDYVEKNGFPGVVLGLSGGIDSALSLAIAVDALGPSRVVGVTMPSRYSADMSGEDAAKQARIMGVEFHEISIEALFQSFLDSLNEFFSGLPIDTTEENIQARCRGVLLMAISNKKGSMVLTTGNKSEMAVGYATLYGDMAGGFDVLKDVPKTLVFHLARYRNTLGEVIPPRVIERPPSAELAPEQKDSDSLPPYDVLDGILEMYVEQELCVDDIVAAGYDETTVRRIVRLVDINEYKRRQAAPGVRISRRAFGRDRRYPITSGFGRRR